MPTARLNGIDLYYETHGEPRDDAPALVFAHGRGGCRLSWWQQIPAFRDDRLSVVFDHRGFGQSSDLPDGPGRRAYADDLAALLDHLRIDRAVTVGQSMGGWTALGFTVAHPERAAGLVLADSSAGVNDPAIHAIYRQRGSPPANVFDRALSRRFKTSDPVRAFLYAEISALSRPPLESLMDLLLSDDGPTPADLGAFRVPTLVIVGSEDVVVPPEVARLTAAALPGARLEVVEGAGHSVYFEQPETFNRLLRGFLSEFG